MATIHKFKADIDIIGVNPFVFITEDILNDIFRQAGKDRGPIPIKGTINSKPYKQTLVKFKGYWRLYVNTTMLKDSPNRIGETIELTITFDPVDRSITPNPKFIRALEENTDAKIIFDGLAPYKKHEIIRYISFLKTEESIDNNIKKAIDFLLGKGRFVGRSKP
jgi:hypothetical protein